MPLNSILFKKFSSPLIPTISMVQHSCHTYQILKWIKEFKLFQFHFYCSLVLQSNKKYMKKRRKNQPRSPCRKLALCGVTIIKTGVRTFVFRHNKSNFLKRASLPDLVLYLWVLWNMKEKRNWRIFKPFNFWIQFRICKVCSVC